MFNLQYFMFSCKSRYKVDMGTRMARIQTTEVADQRYMQSTNNPADDLT